MARVLFLLPFWGLELLFGVAMLWVMGPDRWHLAIACVGAVLAVLAAYIAYRKLAGEYRVRRANPVEGSNWAAMPPEALRVRIATCVRLQGWRVESSEVDATGRVALIARKDRARLVLRCAGTGTGAGTADDVQRLSAARREAGASAAALISPASPSHELRAAAAAANLQVLRFSELEHLDESLGLT